MDYWTLFLVQNNIFLLKKCEDMKKYRYLCARSMTSNCIIAHNRQTTHTYILY